ncbi:restriction endonuclease subunit S [Ruminococcus flavefaciens]|uniref:restriction endonuclease subunit S n=1 Tax=Ruminococcus flavefaciens TaxID=1265 RepID=UPI0012BBD194|nr:restriction endonuclease subunit S [Ruminococcus flavefaciens]
MKDSGVEWIGEIPENWDTIKVKYASWLKGRIGWDGLKSTEYTDTGAYLITGVNFNKGVIDWDSCVHITEERFREDSDIHIKEDDLLITKDGTIGKVAIAKNCPEMVSLNSGVLLIRNIYDFKYHDKYMYYVLLSDVFWRWYTLSQTGQSTIKHLYQEQFYNFEFTFPPLPEQQAISAHLDRQCAHIDNIIEKTKASIEEYKKLRQAVITQAVTKGVRGDRPMKDSGIKWIGEIPEEWSILKSWYTMESLGDIDHFMPESTDNGKPYLMIGDLKEKSSEICFDKCKKISDEDFDNLAVKYKPVNGDIIFARYATIGTVSYVDTDNDFLVSYACVTIRPNAKNMTGKFMFYYFKSSIFIEDIRRFINSNTQGNVGKDSLTKFHMIVPSIIEQKEIAAYLDKKCTEIDSLISKKEQFLIELESYKKSMIYEYVTGKKEVPQS